MLRLEGGLLYGYWKIYDISRQCIHGTYIDTTVYNFYTPLTDCKPGYGKYVDSNKQEIPGCYKCPANTYKSKDGYEECCKCPTGSVTVGSGWPQCSESIFSFFCLSVWEWFTEVLQLPPSLDNIFVYAVYAFLSVSVIFELAPGCRTGQEHVIQQDP